MGSDGGIVDWPSVSLLELTETPATYGVVQPGHDTANGVPMLRVNNFSGNTINLQNVLRISPTVEAKYERTRIKAGDVLITIVGSVGQVAVVPTELAGWNIARAVAMIRPIDLELSRWIAFALRSPFAQHQLGVAANTTVQTTINLKDLRALRVPMPRDEVRDGVCAILGALDDRIDNLRQTNATLEAIAAALFKSWFVDFDPVRAKSEGREPEGMDPATAALFPSEFEDSELGPIPKGWRATPFGTLLANSIGGDWGSEVATNDQTERVSIIRGTDIPDLRSQSECRVPVRFTTPRKMASRALAAGDLVVEVSGGSKDQPTGRSLYVTRELLSQFDCPALPASFCRKFSPSTPQVGVLLGQHMDFIYAAGKTWEYQNQSTGIANFQTKHFLANEQVVVPSEEVLSAFCMLVGSTVERTQLLQAKRLAHLRDTLLPRLISGKLRLPDLETAVAEDLA